MKYDKNKMQEVLDCLMGIQEYDWITYPREDEKEAEKMLNELLKISERWSKMHNDNYSY